MICQKCSSKMTILFTSAVCDVCDGLAAPEKKTFVGFILFYDLSDLDESSEWFKSGPRCFVFKTHQAADEHRQRFNMNLLIHEVFGYGKLDECALYVLVPSDFKGDTCKDYPVIRLKKSS